MIQLRWLYSGVANVPPKLQFRTVGENGDWTAWTDVPIVMVKS